MDDIVSNLIQKLFSSCSFAEKQRIIDAGRPKPHLTISQYCKGGIMRYFAEENYDRIEWLTGSTNSNRLYCWPCLLFGTEKGVWNNKGYSDLSNLSKASKKHIRHKHIFTR